MTQPQPSFERVLISQRNLFTMPLIGFVLRGYASILLANGRVREEAKSILYRELSASVRQGVPLADALDLASQAPAKSASSTAPPAMRALRILAIFAVLVLSPALVPLAMVLGLFFAPRWFGVERIARALAEALHPHVAEGRSLAEAMAARSTDFTASERAMATAGEAAGTLPEAFDTMAAMHTDRERLTMLASPMMAPLFVVFVGMIVGPFAMFKVTPRMVDIYAQMGAELPWATMQLVTLAHILGSRGPFGGILLILGAGIFVAYVLRANMTGTLFSRVLCFLFGYAFTALALWLAILRGAEALPLAGFATIPAQLGSMLPTIAAIPASLIAFLLTPFTLSLIERGFQSAERWLAVLASHSPFIGGPFRLIRAGRSLGIASAAIEAGLTAPEAIRFAGEASGLRLQRAGEEAAALMEMGYPLGEACLRGRLLPPAYGNRLVALDRTMDMPRALRQLGEDMIDNGRRDSARGGRVLSVFATALVCITVSFIALALLMPLFRLGSMVR